MMLQVGVKVFLRNSEGKYLLLHRSAAKYPGTRGTWDIPGGRIEPGSRLLENLQREVREETRLAIASEPVLLAAQDIIPNDERHVVRLTYFSRADGAPVPTLDTEENDECLWLSLAELKALDDMDIYARELVDGGVLNQFEK